MSEKKITSFFMPLSLLFVSVFAGAFILLNQYSFYTYPNGKKLIIGLLVSSLVFLANLIVFRQSLKAYVSNLRQRRLNTWVFSVGTWAILMLLFLWKGDHVFWLSPQHYEIRICNPDSQSVDTVLIISQAIRVKQVTPIQVFTGEKPVSISPGECISGEVINQFGNPLIEKLVFYFEKGPDQSTVDIKINRSTRSYSLASATSGERMYEYQSKYSGFPQSWKAIYIFRMTTLITALIWFAGIVIGSVDMIEKEARKPDDPGK